jgi:hypothetical protein
VHRPLGRTVALKALRSGLGTDPVALERFRREARACAQVRHPNIVEVYDAGAVGGEPYYTMAILRGRALGDVTGTAARPDLAPLLRGFAGVADALRVLHAAGIVHRDVKPSNILVADDGTMILSDFGLARTAQSERVTTTGQALGTPLYMSPEQMLGRASEIDGRADVYGLGAAMYEVFVGRPLFRFEDTAEALRMILREQPEKPRAVRPDLPEALENILLKCLEKRKEDRYQDAAALRDDLLNLAEGRKVVGRPVSDVEHGLRRVRRFVPAIAAGVLATAIGAWAWKQRDATVVVECWPAAGVAIDGVARGETALETKVAPGRHTLTLSQAGFAPRTEKFDVAAGERLTLRQVLVAQKGDDAEALACIGKELDVAMAALQPLTTDRGGHESEPSVQLLWPRGLVRADDAATWRMDVTEAAEGQGRIVFRRDGQVLGEAPFRASGFSNEGEIPAAVRSAIKPGDTVEWSYEPAEGETVTAEFTVCPRDPRPRLDKIAARTREQPKALGAHVRAQFLLDGGYWLAAYREAKALTDANLRDRRAWIVMQRALDGMQLRDTAPWRDACEALAKERKK